MARRLMSVFLVSFFLVSCTKQSEAPAPAPPDKSAAAVTTAPPPVPYDEEIRKWKEDRIARLTSDTGWLTLVGLAWLAEGENSIGTAPRSNVLLPKGKAPKKVGSIFLEKGKVKIVASPDAKVTSDGKPVTTLELRPDTSGNPTNLELGSLKFFVIERGGKFAIRIKDSESDTRRSFKGIDSYPLDPKWRIDAHFTPYVPMKQIPITNVLGQTAPSDCPGRLDFTIDGKPYSLEPILEEKGGDLFFIFGDSTNGTETYGAGRFLYATPAGPDGKVVIDFNKAYNPPCVFTPYATCPLPPQQNKLALAITAGEKRWGSH